MVEIRLPSAAGQIDRQVCWERSVETLTARKDDIAGLAVASDEQIEAYLLYVKSGTEETEIVSLRSFIDDGGARLKQLLSRPPRARHGDLPVSEGPPGRDLEGVGWRRSGSAPPAGIYSTQRGRGPPD